MVVGDLDTLIFMGVGVVLPLFCVIGFIALLGNGIWRKNAQLPFVGRI